MNAHATLKIERPTVTDKKHSAIVDSLPSAIPQRIIEAALPVQTAPQVEPNATTRWRGGVHQLYDSTVRSSWRHGGLND